jgi:UDP-N-acetylglucosamine diphosphorylase/glucosamine-1-phosphate N-acetyltransferase
MPNILRGVFSKGELTKDFDCLWINSRYLPSPELIQAIKNLKEGEFLADGKHTIVALTNYKTAKEWFENNSFPDAGLKSLSFDQAISLNNIWDLVELNAKQIEADINRSKIEHITNSGLGVEAVVENPDEIHIGNNVKIEPGCIFIAKDGPIFIGDKATIEAGSILRGPVAVCEGATVKMAARIYGGATIGPVCKVGGEVSGSIFHSYSNKAHDGFCGNSIFGQWVNLGANTVTSNLKNDYKNIQIIDWDTKKPIDTGRQFLGTIMGDHSKTAINTMLNTGTICGVSSNVFVDDLTPKLINSFTWLGPQGPALYRFDKALEVMQAMMKRRDVELTTGYKRMMQNIFDNR